MRSKLHTRVIICKPVLKGTIVDIGAHTWRVRNEKRTSRHDCRRKLFEENIATSIYYYNYYYYCFGFYFSYLFISYFFFFLLSFSRQQQQQHWTVDFVLTVKISARCYTTDPGLGKIRQQLFSSFTKQYEQQYFEL